jgi:hypothetical protein
MEIDVMRPPKLYRYSEKKLLERSLEFGEFRLRPAAEYWQKETDAARHDDEIVRVTTSPVNSVSITLEHTGQSIKPIGNVGYRAEVWTNYLTICFSKRWDEHLFDVFPNTDACLVIHEVDDFCERMHHAAELALPQWAGMDAAVVYEGKNELGAVFSKPHNFILQHGWRFARRPRQQLEALLILQKSLQDLTVTNDN